MKAKLQEKNILAVLAGNLRYSSFNFFGRVCTGKRYQKKGRHVEDYNSTWVAHKQAENLQRMDILITWDCKNMEDEKDPVFSENMMFS